MNRAFDFIDRAIAGHEHNGITLANWNDADGRTQAEVLAALDRAIALAERES